MSEPMVLAGRYRVDEEIGRGGMSKVFRGTDTVLGRPVAVKVLDPKLAEDETFVSRFRREAQAAARINNPHIVAVYDTGHDGGVDFIVMEYVEGKTLADYLTGGGRILPNRAVEIADDVAQVLDAAHAQGIVHRDIKPSNIIITPSGEVKVTDFGIALLATQDTVAQTLAVLGTAAYLSPEQAQGEAVDARTDIYSLGCVLYEMVAGRPPFVGDTPVAIASKHVLETPGPPSQLNGDVSPALDAVIMKALAKNPANRYQTAREFRDDLERIERGQQVLATPILADAAATQAVPPVGPPTQVMPPAEQEPSGGNRWIWVVAILAALALVIGGLWLFASGLLGDNAQQVKVPSVVGFPQDAATSMLTNAGFEVASETKVTDDPTKVGVVLSQDPSGNTQGDEGSTVTITVGKAPKQVTVPPVTGIAQDQAEAAISEAGLTVGTVTPQADASDPGTVIGQDPTAGTAVAKGTAVNLVVSSGPGTGTVPDVVCFAYGKAKSTLADAGFGIELAGELPPNPLCPSGSKIVQQDPAPNTQADVGATVKVWVAAKPSTGPTPTESPTP